MELLEALHLVEQRAADLLAALLVVESRSERAHLREIEVAAKDGTEMAAKFGSTIGRMIKIVESEMCARH